MALVFDSNSYGNLGSLKVLKSDTSMTVSWLFYWNNDGKFSKLSNQIRCYSPKWLVIPVIRIVNNSYKSTDLL